MTRPNLSPAQDPHAFLDGYLNNHPEDVVVLDEPVSAEEGITGLIYELTALGRAEMVLCRRVGDLGVPVLSNVFASRERVS